MPPTLSVVVPVYNEAEVLPAFYQRLVRVLEQASIDFELVLVNDGSTDDSLHHMLAWLEADPRVAVVDLSRNFGHQIAITAGVDHAGGDAVVVMDADLQDPPEVVPELVARWQDGFDVVYGVRARRDGEGPVKRGTAWLFYRALRLITRVDVPADSGDFRLLSRRAVNALGRLREQNRYLRGMVGWIGFKQAAVVYARAPRFAGSTKYPLGRMLRLAIDAAVSLSTVPLRLSVLLGTSIAFVSLLYAGWVVYAHTMHGHAVPGWSSLVVAVTLLGSAQLVCLGILGEYVGRIYDEVRGRPLYLVGALHRTMQSDRPPRRTPPEIADQPEAK